MHPHKFQTKIKFLKNIEPKIIVTPQAKADMMAIIGLSGKDEIGWLGAVEKEDNIYTITQIYLLEQEVSGASCTLSTDGMGEIFTKLVQDSDSNAEKIMFWGHVHPGNSTSPSAQDEKAMEIFEHNDFFIRGIFSKEDRAEFTLFDFKNGQVYEDAKWVDELPLVSKDWAQEVKEKVSKAVYTVKTVYTAYTHHNNHNTPHYSGGQRWSNLQRKFISEHEYYEELEAQKSVGCKLSKRENRQLKKYNNNNPKTREEKLDEELEAIDKKFEELDSKSNNGSNEQFTN